MAKTIDYYLALSSPWTYLAGPRLKDIAARSGAAVVYKPFAIGKVFAMTGTKPVAQRPPQHQANRLNELRRWRDHLGMPLTLQPKFFPVDPTLAGRMVIAANLAGHDVADLAQAVLAAVWAEERNIADPATLAAIAGAHGLDGNALLAQAEGDAVTAAFDANTREAIERNVFGTPTWIIDGELFWGQDRLDFVARHLGV